MINILSIDIAVGGHDQCFFFLHNFFESADSASWLNFPWIDRLDNLYGGSFTGRGKIKSGPHRQRGTGFHQRHARILLIMITFALVVDISQIYFYPEHRFLRQAWDSLFW